MLSSQSERRRIICMLTTASQSAATYKMADMSTKTCIAACRQIKPSVKWPLERACKMLKNEKRLDVTIVKSESFSAQNVRILNERYFLSSTQRARAWKFSRQASPTVGKLFNKSQPRSNCYAAFLLARLSAASWLF